MKRKCTHDESQFDRGLCTVCRKSESERRAKQRARISDRTSYMESAIRFHELVHTRYLPTVHIETQWTSKVFNDVFNDSETRKRAEVSQGHVDFLLSKFNVENFKNPKKIESRTIVDLFGAGSKTNGHVKSVLATRFGVSDFTLLTVHRPKMSKTISGWQPKDTFDPKEWALLFKANYICARNPVIFVA